MDDELARDAEKVSTMSDTFKNRYLIKSAYRQAVFKEVGATHSVLDLRKIIYANDVIQMTRDKVNPEWFADQLGQNYKEDFIKKITIIQPFIGELWGYLDAFGFTKASPRNFIGTNEFKDYIYVVKEIMPYYEIILRTYVACITDKNFINWGIPDTYLFDFTRVVGVDKLIVRDSV